MSDFDFLAGHVALDFVNTVANRLDSAKTGDLLRTPTDLTAWFAAAGSGAVEGLTEPDLNRARDLREHLHKLFLAFACGEPPAAASLAVVDRCWRAGGSARRLVVEDGRVGLSWADSAGALERGLAPILSAAVELLMSDRVASIRQCEGVGCGWLFLNRSRGNSPRRWCSMSDCGNRAKAGRHYARVRI
ncbi:MAG: ABATE domain-containing protein [Sphingomonas sp.]|uniref:CGNR zinc finger domain-containing protein n=1 Tax=Sphingomonas sp. TaxID=28214 RepID=UPI00356B2D50